MTYYLDTNIVIFMLARGDKRLINRVKKLSPKEIKIPSMVRSELITGAYRCRDPEANMNLLMEFLSPYETVPFDEDASTICGKIRAELGMRGEEIGPNDLVIAATTLSRGGILVMNNTREFSRVDGLQIEDWSK